jgi:hypothetical protein
MNIILDWWEGQLLFYALLVLIVSLSALAISLARHFWRKSK